MPSASAARYIGMWSEKNSGIGTCIPTDYMHMLSLHSPTACGGIGAITLMVGAVILTMAGDGTAGTVRAGALAGAAGTVVAGGDTIITITIIPDIIPVAVVIGEAVAIGEMHIPIDVLMVRAVLLMPETEYRPLLPAVLLL